ncbi:coiled-coil domain-containing protein [Thermodesulfobacteriota bacterium]
MTIKDKKITENGQEIERLKKEAEVKNRKIAKLEEKVSLFLGSDQSRVNKFDDLFKELEIARRRADEAEELKAKVVALEEQKNKLEHIKKVLKKCRIPIEEPKKMEATLEQAAAAKSVLEKVSKHFSEKEGEARSLDEVIKTIEEYPALEQKVSNLKGQVKNIRRKLVSMGRGTEMPACWADPVTGRPEYIFDVALTSSGLIVCDRKLENRKEEQAKLPVSNITFDKEVNPQQFLKECMQLYQWSKKEECRFFVRVFDLTTPVEKETYKRHLWTLEERFYKYEVLNEKFPFPHRKKAIDPIAGYGND